MGYAPVCNCAPLIRKLEQRVESDKQNMYDHIDGCQQMLTQRIDQLDKRASQQVYAIDKLTKERLTAEGIECAQRIDKRAKQEREICKQQDRNQEGVRNELKSWMDHRIRYFERKFVPHEHGCEFRKPRKEREGRLFRSRSDESLTASHYSQKMKNRPRKQETMDELSALNLQKVADARYAFERDQPQEMKKRESPLGAQSHPHFEDLPQTQVRPGAVHLHREPNGYGQSMQDFSRRRFPVDMHLMNELDSFGPNKGTIITQDRGISAGVPRSTTTPVYQNINHLSTYNLKSSEPLKTYNDNNNAYNISKSLGNLDLSHSENPAPSFGQQQNRPPHPPPYRSPDSMMSSDQSPGTNPDGSKGDSSSNPDSGYSGGVYRPQEILRPGLSVVSPTPNHFTGHPHHNVSNITSTSEITTDQSSSGQGRSPQSFSSDNYKPAPQFPGNRQTFDGASSQMYRYDGGYQERRPMEMEKQQHQAQDHRHYYNEQQAYENYRSRLMAYPLDGRTSTDV